jgi:hypothetical protein
VLGTNATGSAVGGHSSRASRSSARPAANNVLDRYGLKRRSYAEANTPKQTGVMNQKAWINASITNVKFVGIGGFGIANPPAGI